MASFRSVMNPTMALMTVSATDFTLSQFAISRATRPITTPMAAAISPKGFAAMTAFRMPPAAAAPRMTVIRLVKMGTMVEMILNAVNPPTTPASTGMSQLAFWMKKETAPEIRVNATLATFPMVWKADEMVSLFSFTQLEIFVTTSRAFSWICGMFSKRMPARVAFTPMSFSPTRSVVRPMRFWA